MKVRTLMGVVAAALYLSSCQTKAVETPEGYISKDTANLMIGSYLAGNAADTLDSDSPNLNSLIFNADLLRNYLSNTEIQNVKVMFAHTLKYIHSGNAGQNAGYHSGELTLIMAGYDRNGNYIFAPGGMVPDHATPCPRNCPEVGTASADLLQ